MHLISPEQSYNSLQNRSRLTADTFAKLSRLSKVVIKPQIVVLEPSYDEDSTIPFRIVNQTESLISFKIRVTQSKFLTASPVFGVMQPLKGAIVVLKLKRILNTSFVLSTDRVSIRLIFVPEGLKFDDPVELWDGPTKVRDIVGRKMLEVHYLRRISGTFTGEPIQPDDNEKPLKDISHTPSEDSETQSSDSSDK
uniref:MSP domain-containing protein n=1 Tax=Trichuris muris TaxID=70415 RepID=A0A5S6QIJ7_TRIMR